jgi:membrane-associated phospholipid phosphatase
MSLLIAGRRLLPQAAARRLPNEHAVVDVLLAFVIAGAIALLLVYAAKTGFDMPRPYSALPAGSVNLLVELREPYSLPSGHAAFAMLVACVLWPASPGRWKAALVLAVVWVGVSRVNVGAHFPADVVAGIICGGGSAWLGGKVRKLAASSMKSG